jgi:hypothetical protein
VTASRAPAGARITHALVRERFGEPDLWEGSVNDPRTRDENGVRWNEKWVWLLPDGARRIVYWHRYDFRGALRESASGEVQEESL